MIRIVFGLFFSLMSLGGYLAFDLWNVNRMAKFNDGDGVTVGEYLQGWLSLADVIGGAEDDAVALPAELAAMMPKAPEGWTMRPTEPSDVDALLPPDGNEEALAYVRQVLNPREGNGLKQVRQTYVNGPRTVVFELLRHPDFIFTSFGATAIKMELGMTRSKFDGRDFMTVRGMEIHEDVLPEEIGLRYFVGDVADQIWVRVLASRGMTDEELLPFFQTLHVPAMNANVVEHIAGMGEVPVIVLASVIDAETRAARDAERAVMEAEQAEEQAKAEAERAAAEEAEQKVEDEKAKGIETDEDTGVKVRKGTGEGKKKAEKKTGGFADDSCTVESGRKVCGGIEAPVEE